MYIEASLIFMADDTDWLRDAETMESDWHESGACPVPVIKLSVNAIDIVRTLWQPEIFKTAIPALGCWLVARLGRKVHLRIGDTEITVSSVQELEQVIDLVDGLHEKWQGRAE